MRFEAFMIPVLCLSSALAASTAQAADIYNNLSQTVFSTSGPGDSARVGLSFATNATDVVLSSVVIPVQNFMSLTSGTVDMYLFDASGAGALPGTQLAALGSAPISSFPSATYQNFTVSGLSINLASTTNYWIVMGGTNLSGGNYNVGLTNNSTGAGPLSIGSAVFSGGSWSAQSSFYVIGSVSAVPVPEPASLAMAAISAGVFLGLAGRRKSSTTRGCQQLAGLADFDAECPQCRLDIRNNRFVTSQCEGPCRS